MFTGIVRARAVDDVERNEAGARLRISGAVASKLATGDSVSVEGACLTVAGLDGNAFEADR